MTPDSVSVRVSLGQFFLAHIHLAKVWHEQRSEELDWFLGSISGTATERPQNVFPPTVPASPRTGDFGRVLCRCCRTNQATGEFRCRFVTYEQILPLCAGCAMHDAYSKWHGGVGKKLLRAELVVTLDRERKVHADFEVKRIYLPPAQYFPALAALTTRLGVRLP